jgi:hypothetical protein
MKRSSNIRNNCTTAAITTVETLATTEVYCVIYGTVELTLHNMLTLITA